MKQTQTIKSFKKKKTIDVSDLMLVLFRLANPVEEEIIIAR